MPVRHTTVLMNARTPPKTNASAAIAANASHQGESASNACVRLRNWLVMRSLTHSVAPPKVSVNQSTKLSLGNQDTKHDLGAATTEAMQKIELKVGQSKITIDQMGVKIEGMMIEIKGQLMVKVEGLMVQQQGTAMMTIKGGIVMIN